MIFIGKYTYRNMNKKLIRLTESDLHRIVRESVNKVLNEAYTAGVQVRQYTNKLWQIIVGGEAVGYADATGRVFDRNMQPCRPNDCIKLSDDDAATLAQELNRVLGNKFHYDMFR